MKVVTNTEVSRTYIFKQMKDTFEKDKKAFREFGLELIQQRLWKDFRKI